MKGVARRRIWLATALGLVALAGCSDTPHCGDGTYQENDECKAGIDPRCGQGTVLQNGACVADMGSGGACGAGTHLEGGDCLADVSATGNAARLYDVHLTEPAEFVALADTSLHSSFMSGANLVFLGVYRPTFAVTHVFGGGGTRNPDGTFALDRATSFDAAATTTGGTSLQTVAFVFQLSGFGSSTPIKLVDTTLTEANLDSSGGATLIHSAKLSGVLTPEAAANVYIDLANESMLELLQDVGVPPSVDQDGNGTKESWRITLTFTTMPVWLF